MAREFSPATAEQVIAVVEAVAANPNPPVELDWVAAFADLPADRAEAALKLAVDLGFLSKQGDNYKLESPLSKFVITPNPYLKAAVLRVLLESYHPFHVFRESLAAIKLADTAAHRTKMILDLIPHRDSIKDTLISLGTYAQALVAEGAGQYRANEQPFENILEQLVKGCEEATAAEIAVKNQLGSDVVAVVSNNDVIVPLRDAIIYAKQEDARSAVVNAGNAVESYLTWLGSNHGVNLTGATGINAKMDKFDQQKKLPKKHIFVGKYLGHIRNAADHGIDSDINAAWKIKKSTGIEYVFVACSFIAATISFTRGNPPEI